MKQWVLVLFRGKVHSNFAFIRFGFALGYFVVETCRHLPHFRQRKQFVGARVSAHCFFQLILSTRGFTRRKVHEISAISCNFELLVVVFGS